AGADTAVLAVVEEGFLVLPNGGKVFAPGEVYLAPGMNFEQGVRASSAHGATIQGRVVVGGHVMKMNVTSADEIHDDIIVTPFIDADCGNELIIQDREIFCIDRISSLSLVTGKN